MATGEGESVSMANGLPQLFSDFSSLDKPVLIAVALSCEAAGADAAFVVDESNKDAMGVANDLKVLLNDSKLVGKVADASVSEFPQDLGSFRKYCKLTRSQLNSPNSSEKVLSTDFSSLSQSLWYLVEGSYSRAKRNVEAVRDMGMRESLASLFARDCPTTDALVGLFSSSGQACFGGEYVKFFQGLHSFVECGRSIVSWEIVTALISLVGSELLAEKTEGNEVSGECGKVDKKKKKNKVVLGKGTLVLVQYLKDNLLNGVPALQLSVFVEKCVEFFMSLLDPKNSGFGMLMEKVKEIVESNEKRRRPKIAKGTLDNANEKMAVREKAFSTIQGVFKKHGATALDTPVFELRETLTGKYGEESKLIYDLADQGGELCSLRYDLTVPFARYVAMNGLTSFKRYQIAKVYRRENTSKGRLREFYQCDFDIAGQYETMGPDFEAIKVITELLDDLNIGEYEVKLNHRKILDAILDICGVPAEKFKAICSSIDKLDKLSFEQVKKEMVEEKGLTGDVADLIGTYVKIRGPPMEVLSMLKLQGSKFLEKEQSLSALNELEILFKALKAAKCINKIVFDLSLARGLDYYTGVIFEAVIIKEGATQVGSIGGGGRYDNLIGMFGDKQVPAVGVSLGIERVFMIMEQIQKDQNQVTRSTETEVLVSIIGNDIENDLPLAAEISSDLWAAGIKTEFMVNKRMDKHTNRVKASKIPWMVIVGDHERNDGVVTLKDMTKKTPNEEKLPLDVNYVNEILSRVKGISS